MKDVPESEISAVDRVKLSFSKLFLSQEDASGAQRLKAMNLQIYEDELREVRSKVLVDLLFVAVSLLSGAACMTAIEHWAFADAFYWACVTVSHEHEYRMIRLHYTVILCL
jgi:hypothetical protein